MAKVPTERLEHFANTQNAITGAHFLAITLNERDYVVAAGILISYAFKCSFKTHVKSFDRFRSVEKVKYVVGRFLWTG